MAILIVGAGFAGATYARTLADHGWPVTVIDQRPHIGGNTYDEFDHNGIRVHRYGPHLFHTNNENVVRWLEQFAAWVPYEHRVCAVLPNRALAPLPINRTTLERVFGTTLPDAAAAEAFLHRIAEPLDHPPANAAEQLWSTIGRELTDLFFRPYTRKMWDLDLEDLDAAVVQRLPLRFDDDNRYFPNDRFQMLPRDGYTSLFERILDHPLIEVHINTAFDKTMQANVTTTFASMPIDAYYDFRFGELPYRSIRFDHRSAVRDPAIPCATLNFTDAGPFTRETLWHRLPQHDLQTSPLATITREAPCNDKDNDMERYYPVKTADNRYQALYQDYKRLADSQPDIQFIGRCGTYQYLDMHQVVNQSLAGAHRWLKEHGPGPGKRNAPS